MRDLMQMLREDTEAQARIASYGIDPRKVEEWLTTRTHYSDPTANEAINNVMREQGRR